mmetsp:Transcript_13987/g.41675  ORF Transcript_13987/g.41675 Transcript_13987/m.41675 type:complete len:363 (+) Transcript_13987:198-1286(+)
MGCAPSTPEQALPGSATPPSLETFLNDKVAPVKKRYAFGETLAHGADAHVVAATRLVDGERVAIKVLRIRRRAGAARREASSSLIAAPEAATQKPPPRREAIQRELMIQRALPAHAHVVPTHEVVLAPDTSYVVMARARGGTLLDWISASDPAEPEVKAVAAQCFEALAFLHALGVVHRDVKLENLLVRDAAGPPHVLLADFGSARLAGGRTPSEDLRVQFAGMGRAATAHVGTLGYMAPEQLTGGTADAALDCWSAGIVMCALAVRRHPLGDLPRGAWPAEMAKDDLPPAHADWRPDARDLAHALLRYAPADRISAAGALDHAWFDVDPEDVGGEASEVGCGCFDSPPDVRSLRDLGDDEL